MRRDRRGFLSSVAAAVGLLASYGLLGAYGIAYLFPPRREKRRARLYVGRLPDLLEKPRLVSDPRGRSLLLLGIAGRLEAFDTRCPHLGCRVHWEPEKSRFFCPCHNGVFDSTGRAVAGPPAEAGQSLEKVPLEIDPNSGNVFLLA
ncbi:MAG: hypothetical protein KatS3mg076_0374 [Candidatus Binatia bacterium]|nr:MAG: hypothetical protein KatS3mg076_0374 [Candidatus Binatia bacterium]